MPAGESFQVKTLEDFSIRTLYNKLEDQSLHMATQLSNHRSDALAFYKGASQQLQELKVSLNSQIKSASSPMLQSPKYTHSRESDQHRFFQNFLQSLSPTDRQDFNGSENPEMAAKDSKRASTWQTKGSWGRHTAVSPSDHWQHAKGKRQNLDGAVKATGKFSV